MFNNSKVHPRLQLVCENQERYSLYKPEGSQRQIAPKQGLLQALPCQYQSDPGRGMIMLAACVYPAQLLTSKLPLQLHQVPAHGQLLAYVVSKQDQATSPYFGRV